MTERPGTELATTRRRAVRRRTRLVVLAVAVLAVLGAGALMASLATVGAGRQVVVIVVSGEQPPTRGHRHGGAESDEKARASREARTGADLDGGRACRSESSPSRAPSAPDGRVVDPGLF